jgi:hypothetical protein
MRAWVCSDILFSLFVPCALPAHGTNSNFFSKKSSFFNLNLPTPLGVVQQQIKPEQINLLYRPSRTKREKKVDHQERRSMLGRNKTGIKSSEMLARHATRTLASAPSRVSSQVRDSLVSFLSLPSLASCPRDLHRNILAYV